MHEKHDEEEGGDRPRRAEAGVCGRIHIIWDIMHDTLPFVFPGADEVEVFARFQKVHIWRLFTFPRRAASSIRV